MSLNEICSRIKHMNMQVLSEYLDYLEIEKGLAENTLEAYRRAIFSNFAVMLILTIFTDLKSTHMSETCMKRSFHLQVL